MSRTSKRKPNALVIRTAGTNCDKETVHALQSAGSNADLIHVNQLLLGRVRLHPYHLLVLPGGFSYGDDISAGKVLAVELQMRLKDQLKSFIESKKLIIGICNGFQVLVKTGLLPGFDGIDDEQTVTLTRNDSGRFQCEWVEMEVQKSAAAWLRGLPKKIELPVANAEGKFITASPKILRKLNKNNQIVFRYHPRNPNGSQGEIAGLTNPAGNVVGLMPHPERYLTFYEHPNWAGRLAEKKSDLGDGSYFWTSAVAYAKNNLN